MSLIVFLDPKADQKDDRQMQPVCESGVVETLRVDGHVVIEFGYGVPSRMTALAGASAAARRWAQYARPSTICKMRNSW